MEYTLRRRLCATLIVASMLAMSTAAALPPPALPPLPSSVGAAAPFQPLANVYEQDFEFDDGGYTVAGTAGWEYGSPVSPPTTMPGQGANVWGTVLAGDYANNACGSLTSAPIDLSALPAGAATGASAARLAFRHWIHVENRYDAGLVQVSTDGESWQAIAPVGGYPANPLTTARACMGLPADGRAYSSSVIPAADAWTLAEFDVTAFLGSTIQVRWVFASDSSVVKRGWYIDDVLVQLGVGAAASVDLTPVTGTQPTVPFTAASVAYAEDFELTDGGWSASGSGAWSWGSPTAPPVTPVGSLNVWGARMFSNVTANECAQLTSPAIEIPGAPASGAEVARLSFKLWRHLENGYDGAHLEASTDGGATWERLTPNAGYDRALTSSFAATTRACLGISTGDAVWTGPSAAPRDDEWMDVSVDVTSLMGSSAQFRFVLGTEASGELRGVFVDDVVLQLGAGAIVDASPSNPTLPGILWTVEGTNPSWEFGFSTDEPSNVPVWATRLNGQYNANECSAIVSTPIDTDLIPGLGRLELSFQHAFDSYSSADGGVIQVSRDGGATWATIVPVGGYGGTVTAEARDCLYAGSLVSPGWYGAVATDWTGIKANLNGFLGDTIQIRFLFGSSAFSQDVGWAIRSIALTRGAGSVPLAAEVELMDGLLAKADPELRAAILAGATEDLRVLIAGKAHEGVAALGFETRAEYGAWFDAKGGPLVAALREIVALGGGEEINAWTMLPGMAARVDLSTLLAIAAEDDVETIVLDRDDAVQLIDPIEDDSVSASNTAGRQMLQAEEIWALGYRGAGITVSVIDTGIWAGHEAFKNADGSSRVALFADCMDATCAIAAPWDDHGHGTHVAGTSVGSSLFTDPSFGVYQETGVAPEARLAVAKFLSGSGSGSFAAGVDSINWSFHVAQADITSNSWGASGCSSSAWPVMQIVRTTTDAGMVNVFAAGNSGPGSSTIGSPGCSESALTIGAVDVNRNIASFSSRGPCSDTEIGGPSRICPDVVAKGVAVRSAIPRSGAGNADPSGYKTWQGTSMATPHISGAVALAEQMKRDLTGSGWDTANRAEEQVLKMTAEDLGAAGEDSTFGWGLPQLLNIYALLNSTDEVNLVSSFGISKPIVRQGDSTLLTFSVRNLGGATATGDFLATLTDPAGGVTTLKSASASLALLDGVSSSTAFTVTGSVAPGTYTFRGRFDYSWIDPNTNETVTGTIEREGTFDVKRVFVQFTMDGLDTSTLPGDLQSITYTATNRGNENASAVTLEVTVRDDYVFVPGANFDPTNMNTRYANPAPSRVIEDSNFGRITLVFDVGELPQGGAFSFTTQLLPTAPGTYNFMNVARWQDGGGSRFTQGSNTLQVVGLPDVPAP